MAIPTSEPEIYRRRQRRRALIGWAGGLLAVAATSLILILAGGESAPRRLFKVQYGEYMTAADFAEIKVGEEGAVVLERLDETGRPESLTEPYVLDLFPPREEGTYCTYWEFSDQPRIFARLCFSGSGGELVDKRKNNVFNPVRGEAVQGQVA